MSTLGTAFAGMFHTLAAAIGISALLATSALAFSVVKWAGAAYLVYLGVRTILDRSEHRQVSDVASPEAGAETAKPSGVARGALLQGFLTEVLNPKTALFFLAFIPQFINPEANAFLQFVILGFTTTLLTSGADMLVVLAAGPLSKVLKRSRRLQAVQRVASGGTLVGLGVYVVVRE